MSGNLMLLAIVANRLTQLEKSILSDALHFQATYPSVSSEAAEAADVLVSTVQQFLPIQQEKKACRTQLRYLEGKIDISEWHDPQNIIEALTKSFKDKTLGELINLDVSEFFEEVLDDSLNAELTAILTQGFLDQKTVIEFANCSSTPAETRLGKLAGLSLDDPLTLVVTVGLGGYSSEGEPTWAFSLRDAVNDMIQINEDCTPLEADDIPRLLDHNKKLADLRDALRCLAEDIDTHLPSESAEIEEDA